MTTSVHDAIIRVASTHWGNALDPVDAATHRDVTLNNLCHLADEYGQMRIKWSQAGSALGKNTFFTPRLSGVTAIRHYPVYVSHAFPILMQSTGDYQSSRLRVTLGGSSSSASGTASFKVIVHPAGVAADPFGEGENALTASTSSTSSAYLTLTNASTLDTDGMMWLSSDGGAAPRVVTTSTFLDVTGRRVTVEQVLVRVTVLASISNAAYYAKLDALSVAEHGFAV